MDYVAKVSGAQDRRGLKETGRTREGLPVWVRFHARWGRLIFHDNGGQRCWRGRNEELRRRVNSAGGQTRGRKPVGRVLERATRRQTLGPGEQESTPRKISTQEGAEQISADQGGRSNSKSIITDRLQRKAEKTKLQRSWSKGPPMKARGNLSTHIL